MVLSQRNEPRNERQCSETTSSRSWHACHAARLTISKHEFLWCHRATYQSCKKSRTYHEQLFILSIPHRCHDSNIDRSIALLAPQAAIAHCPKIGSGQHSTQGSEKYEALDPSGGAKARLHLASPVHNRMPQYASSPLGATASSTYTNSPHHPHFHSLVHAPAPCPPGRLGVRSRDPAAAVGRLQRRSQSADGRRLHRGGNPR